MTGDKEKLSDGVDLLAQAMRKVFGETVETDPEPAREDVEDGEARPEGSRILG